MIKHYICVYNSQFRFWIFWPLFCTKNFPFCSVVKSKFIWTFLTNYSVQPFCDWGVPVSCASVLKKLGCFSIDVVYIEKKFKMLALLNKTFQVHGCIRKYMYLEIIATTEHIYGIIKVIKNLCLQVHILKFSVRYFCNLRSGNLQFSGNWNRLISGFRHWMYSFLTLVRNKFV